MARHKDIDRASSLLEGSQGWIIENHPESITNPNIKRTKRSRNKCSYYNDGLCNHAHAICMGVSCGSHCEKL